MELDEWSESVEWVKSANWRPDCLSVRPHVRQSKHSFAAAGNVYIHIHCLVYVCVCLCFCVLYLTFCGHFVVDCYPCQIGFIELSFFCSQALVLHHISPLLLVASSLSHIKFTFVTCVIAAIQLSCHLFMQVSVHLYVC